MKKRAQFYLAAVIIILALLASVYTVYNKIITNSEDKSNYNEAKEISFEISRVLERGIYLSESDDQIAAEVKRLTDFYADANTLQSLIIIFATNQKIYFYYYNNSATENVEINFGEKPIELLPSEFNFQEANAPRNEDSIRINMNEHIKYQYTPRKGPFVYVVAKEETNDEKYIFTSE